MWASAAPHPQCRSNMLAQLFNRPKSGVTKISIACSLEHDCGALVKQQILRKASLNTGENAHPAKWRKPGPLGKGNY